MLLCYLYHLAVILRINNDYDLVMMMTMMGHLYSTLCAVKSQKRVRCYQNQKSLIL